ARVPERVHDLRRRRDERARDRTDDLGGARPEPELELALEDVERVRVPEVDVRVRPLLAGRVPEPGHRQLLAVDQEPKRSPRLVEDGLALTGPADDHSHVSTLAASACLLIQFCCCFEKDSSAVAHRLVAWRISTQDPSSHPTSISSYR